MVSPFHIERLPALAIAEVAAHMDILEIVNLSLISKRFCVWMTRHTKKIPICLGVENEHYGKFLTFKTDNSYMYAWNLSREPFMSDALWRFAGPKTLIETKNKKVSIDWKDQAIGFNAAIDYFVGNFNVKNISFEIKDTQNPESFFKVLMHAKQIGLALETVKWKFIGSNDQLRRHVLGAVSNASELVFDAGDSPSFTFDKFHEFSVQKLKIENAAFVTVENVLAMTNIANIWLVKPKISNSDVNFFLKKWISGEMGHLESLSLQSRDCETDVRVVLEGLNAVEQDDFYIIQNVNGVEAGLNISENKVYFYNYDYLVYDDL